MTVVMNSLRKVNVIKILIQSPMLDFLIMMLDSVTNGCRDKQTCKHNHSERSGETTVFNESKSTSSYESQKGRRERRQIMPQAVSMGQCLLCQMNECVGK